MYQRHEPSALFHGLHHAHKRRVVEEQTARGLEAVGAPWLLVALYHAEERGERWSQRDVARIMGISPATVAVSLKTLERNGYVARSTDEQDARRNRMTLTAKGKSAVKLCGESFRAVDKRMLADFSPAEKEQLGEFLIRMIDNLGGAEPPLFCASEKEGKKGW